MNTPHHDGSHSFGERRLQQQLGTTARADDFYDRQVRAELTPQMREFIARQPMVFLSTADARGNCDTSFRAGPPGFVQTLDERTLIYPEYRGNGVLASAGNISENPHIGLLFMDFSDDHVGLHVNGAARLRAAEDQQPGLDLLSAPAAAGRTPQMWIHITVHEAYIHCSKHIPHLVPAPRDRNSARNRPKDAEYFTETARQAVGPAGR
ncbi:pyridoxamine 5'-phosphate oxidase family protein [Streptomyces sp. NBC_01267]|uniref:pyridoxamine 5'-phosphate oxidase family protein n=1 Tax=unclassified Streptomyces TaxID=2593676 RepID=UPI002024B0AC|nr:MULTISPECIES: pyridoxamine 5'-phosphate oxidase family protein [unclassified Streptomyces]MCX4549766.1 pyridoxamine 5'-phosphate oxidase family protein [Streptomyces sp. NBC_01500]WSC21292.1 pyridoxamine 5'-phosphate oxidase family protein [Streptomyces sp. NBC_01766]WSV55229.1 pyridoxamine 5'-phosphate oxidase family protein [Streptomyces sp. NBC_01014]